ncbi:MAG: EAL domain-containing protein [Allosphingosinicella sp.]|uniref:EAL domain-containing protein n=1 Tax=Allosphingosinicella sp. TaxID=2823234 RepID=UPI0039452BB4
MGLLSSSKLMGLRASEPRQPAPAPETDRFVSSLEQTGKAWFWEVDRDGYLTYLTESVAARAGMSGEAIRRHRLAELVRDCWTSEDDCIGTERSLSFHLSRSQPFTDLNVRSAADPDLIWSLTGRPILSESGELLGYRGIGSDLSDKIRAEAELRRAARYDSLTDLPNRATILKHLEETLLVSRRSRCALMIVDLDRFKDVNDSHGHLVGDELLRQVAERLRQIVGTKGKLGRLGGDEFEVVMPGGSREEDVRELAASCIKYVSIPYKVGDRTLSVGASIGIAFSAEEDDAESLFRKADLALYAAKARRGVASLFEPHMEIAAVNRQALEHELRTALGEGGLSLWFQPVVSGTSETLVGFEALVRWEHPVQGFISPETFIGVAEESGLIMQLGEWVLRAACHEAARWPDHLFVAVNVSPTQFTDSDFTRILLQALADAQFPAARLELEVTEAVFLSNNPNVDRTFEALKRIGVRLVLDDFGTGYSSLAYLSRAPFDKLKIDRSFVRGACLPGSKDLPILESIVGLAHRLELEITAEGAETHQDLELIRRLECTYVQGFIFGKAAGAEETRELALASAPVDAGGFTFSRAQRHRLIRRLSVFVGGRRLTGLVRNVSATGALIELDQELSAGLVVKIELPGYEILEAEVRWVRGKRAGVRFVSEFDLGGILTRNEKLA